MTERAKKLLDEILALPTEDQQWITETLVERVPRPVGNAFDLHPAWHEELRRRAEQIERGEVVAEDWRKVRERHRRKHRK